MTRPAPLAGRHIGVTADRRWRAQADLFENLGAEVLHGPTMRTVDLSRDEGLRGVTVDLIASPPAYLVASTGMGMTMWLEAADAWGLGEALRAALRKSRVVARGAKACSALRRHGLDVSWQAPSETMDEIIDFLEAAGAGAARVAVQLFDPAGHPSTAALAERCGELVAVPVYRWLMPDDPAPASRLVEAACAGRLDAVTFTSQPAVRHLFRIAEDLGRAEGLRAACNTSLRTVCVGSVCAEAAVAEGITHPTWPNPPRLTAMVRLVASELGAPPAL